MNRAKRREYERNLHVRVHLPDGDIDVVRDGDASAVMPDGSRVTLGETAKAWVSASADMAVAIYNRAKVTDDWCSGCGCPMGFHGGGPVQMRSPFSGRGCINFVETGSDTIGRCGCPAVPAAGRLDA